MRFTERDDQIVDLDFQLRALTGEQVHTALFPPTSDSRCQRRLTLLVRNRYLDRLPRESVSDPAIYLLSRRSIHGNRLMRARYGEVEFRRHMTRLGSLPHLLAINHVRVRAARACEDLGWTLDRWDRAEDLGVLLKDKLLIPDAYFRIRRRTEEGLERMSGFFLELQRAVKSQRILERKLCRYLDLYQSGRYRNLFGIPAMRVLVVFTDEPGGPGELRAQRGVELAERIGAPPVWFASLRNITTCPPAACLLDPIWRAPGQSDRQPLFDVGAFGRPCG